MARCLPKLLRRHHPSASRLLRRLLRRLQRRGLFLGGPGLPATCFNASNYGALLVVDSEDEWYTEEVAKLAADVSAGGMGEPALH